MPTIPRTLVAPLLAVALAACGGGGGDTTPRASGTPATTETPSPTPTLPTKAEDAKLVKSALVTPADLGKPWVQPKAVNQTTLGKEELCPGKPNDVARAKPRASAKVSMTQGTKPGATISTFRVRTLEPGGVEAWHAALAAAQKACASWKAAEGNFVVLTPLKSPVAVEGADEVLGQSEHVYADAKHTQLQYARHVLYARTGRVVSMCELAFLTPKTDPKGLDYTPTAKLLGKQVAKVKTTFGESLAA